MQELTRQILTEHKEQFLQVAALLKEKEVIFADDMEKIFGPKVGGQPEQTVDEQNETL